MAFFPRERPWHTWALIVMQNNDIQGIWSTECGRGPWSTIVDPQGSIRATCSRGGGAASPRSRDLDR